VRASDLDDAVKLLGLLGKGGLLPFCLFVCLFVRWCVLVVVAFFFLGRRVFFFNVRGARVFRSFFLARPGVVFCFFVGGAAACPPSQRALEKPSL
jgi:hypothetical protein